MPKDSDFKKECRESEYRRNILEALLYYSATNENIMLPTIEELVHREVVDGIVEYITGEESKYQPYHDINLEKYMWDYFQKNLPNAKNKLEPKLENAFVKMLEPHWKSDEWGDGEHETELTRHFRSGVCNTINCSTFSLSHQILNDVQNKIIPSLPKSEKENLEKIGKLMRKYIDRDLEYIRKNYWW